MWILLFNDCGDSMKKLYLILIFAALAGCDLKLSDEGPAREGIIIYANRNSGEILNGTEQKIVAKRNQNLYAVSLSGGTIEWRSTNPAVIEVVDQTGFIRVGQSVGKKATVIASLKNNPSVRAEVTFEVRDLR